MNFNKHLGLEGQHAFLGGSRYSWTNYDEDKLSLAYKKYLAVERGIALHEFACKCIELGQKLPKTKKTLNQYVNDAIGFRMTPEQILFYSNNSFGTADAICFRDNLLRIHDLKTGVTPTTPRQLEVYAALFCLEYSYKPSDIEIELRIYQEETILIDQPEALTISSIMEKIIMFDKKIEKIKLEEQ